MKGLDYDKKKNESTMLFVTKRSLIRVRTYGLQFYTYSVSSNDMGNLVSFHLVSNVN